eukprot:2481500-Rhodomonas_salina.1
MCSYCGMASSTKHSFSPFRKQSSGMKHTPFGCALNPVYNPRSHPVLQINGSDTCTPLSYSRRKYRWT